MFMESTIRETYRFTPAGVRPSSDPLGCPQVQVSLVLHMCLLDSVRGGGAPGNLCSAWVRQCPQSGLDGCWAPFLLQPPGPHPFSRRYLPRVTTLEVGSWDSLFPRWTPPTTPSAPCTSTPWPACGGPGGLRLGTAGLGAH